MQEAPVRLIEPRRFGDARGWFTETYSEPVFAQLGIGCRFVQDNHSLSVPRFTLRGLHFQTPPHGQDKLVRCIRGRVFDVAVDVRRGSPTFGQWVGAELSAENGHQLFIPIGFVASVYGMNFDPSVSPWNMPELHWRYGYPYALLVMAAMACGMLAYFWAKGWIGRRRRGGRAAERDRGHGL